MPSVTINEKDYTIYNSINDSDNIVFVPGFTITGPYDEPRLLSSYADLIKIYGDMPPTEQFASGGTNTTYKMCTSWEYASEILNKGFPVLFQRIAPYKIDEETGEEVVDTDKLVSAGVEYSNADGEFKFKLREKTGGTYGNRLQLIFVINNAQSKLYLKVVDTFSSTVLEYIKICDAKFINDATNTVDRDFLFNFATGFISAIDSSDYIEFDTGADYESSIPAFNEFIEDSITTVELPNVTWGAMVWQISEDGVLSLSVDKTTNTEHTEELDTYEALPESAEYDSATTYFGATEAEVTAETFAELQPTLYVVSEGTTYVHTGSNAVFNETTDYFTIGAVTVDSPEAFAEMKADLRLPGEPVTNTWTTSVTETITSLNATYTEVTEYNSDIKTYYYKVGNTNIYKGMTIKNATEFATELARHGHLYILQDNFDFSTNIFDKLLVNLNVEGSTHKLERSKYILGFDPSIEGVSVTVGKDYTYNEAIKNYDPETETVYTAYKKLCDSLKKYLISISDNILYDVKFITKGAIPLSGKDELISSQDEPYNTIVANFCQNRGDCVTLLEPPYMYGQDGVPNEFMEVAGTSATYTAAYAPWCVCTLFNGYQRWCPPSLVFLIALEDSVAEGNPVYLPPAGVNRATVEEVVTSEYRIGSAIMNKWQDKNELRNVNPIMNLNNYGFVIFGQRTLYDVSDQIATYRSALQEFGVRLAVIECKKRIRQVATGLLFQYNNIHTWNEFKAGVRPLFETMVNNGALQRYKIIMDESTTSAYDIDENKIRGIIKVVPGRAVEDFVISFELYRSDVTFDDEDVANSREDISNVFNY